VLLGFTATGYAYLAYNDYKKPNYWANNEKLRDLPAAQYITEKAARNAIEVISL
jgi:hypothetical protein